MSVKHLDTRVVVRKIAVGRVPYGWEIYDEASSLPRYISPIRFKSMQTAYEAGQAWIANSTATTKRPQPQQQPVQRPRRSVRTLRKVETEWSNDTDDETDDDVLLCDEVDQQSAA